MNRPFLISQSAHRPYILVTGVTGLLGQYLMRDLLRSGRALAVLVRSNERNSALERVKAILRRFETEFDEKLPRPIVLAGDVCRAAFGCSKRQLAWINQNCDAILHNAASLQFQSKACSGEPYITNVNGTKRVLDLARQTDIKQLHHVSTAYVCGKRSERVFETELFCGQSFRNEYEHSKFMAEQLVHAAHHLSSVTVYRPVVIAGDSQTGFTSTYHGVFLYLRLIATMIPMLKQDHRGMIKTPIKLPLDGNEPRNLVTVDWVSRVMTHLINSPEAHGRTFHLSPDHCLTNEEFINFCCEFFHTYGVEFVGRNAARQSDSELAARMFENVKIYEEYETSDPKFDKSNLLRFAGHLSCPRIDREMIFRFIKFGQANGWGKRKRPVPITDASAPSGLSTISLPTS